VRLGGQNSKPRNLGTSLEPLYIGFAEEGAGRMAVGAVHDGHKVLAPLRLL
jgi:hypothetical protein